MILPTGSSKERAVFNRALNRVNSGGDQEGDSREEPLKMVMKFEEVKTKMLTGNMQLYNAR